jgi:2-polyprenyl-3-methyl-5-hydroxy-6-metoxy-1,4-benzoquinol methylase
VTSDTKQQKQIHHLRKKQSIMNAEFWNDRYSEDGFAYGNKPNEFFKEQIDKLPVGKILFPCEGEGRNAAYAASLGWDVEAFDLSEVGKEKAIDLAASFNAKINYHICDVANANFENNSFDAVVLIYSHLPESLRITLHGNIKNWLKPGGVVILEAYNPLQLNNTSGGPKDLNMLYSIETLMSDFHGMHFEILEEKQVELNEGKYHIGIADVVRFIGRK